MRSLLVLVGGSLGLWAALIYPGWRWWGELSLIQSAAAWGLCIVPGIGTTFWALQRGLTADTRTLVILAGTGVRIFVALGGGLLLTETWPDLFTKVFWFWIGVFYLSLLSLEVLLLTRRRQDSESIGS